MFRSIIEDVICGIVRAKIQERVELTCSSYDVRHLSDLETWLDTVVHTWLHNVARFLNSSLELSQKSLLQYLHDSFVKFT